MRRRQMPGMISETEMEWVRPAMREFRRIWGNKATECSRKTGVARWTLHRWLSGEFMPSMANLGAFKRACEASGIEVRNAQSQGS